MKIRVYMLGLRGEEPTRVPLGVEVDLTGGGASTSLSG